MNVAIRRAVFEDAPTVAATIRRAFAEYRDNLVPPSGALSETAESIAAELAVQYEAAIATLDAGAAGETVVGCVLFRPDGSDLYFGRLSVLPAYRGAGIARALVAHVEAEAALRGCPGVVLGVRVALPANQRFFARLGYAEVARHAHPGFDHETWIEMRKELAGPR